MSKKIINRIEVTPAQLAVLQQAVDVLGELCIAYDAANPGINFEINLKVERKLDMSGPSPWTNKVIPWWQCGDFMTSTGWGRKIEDALAMHFAATDATEKRKSAERCRRAADQLEREAKELEAAAAKSV